MRPLVVTKASTRPARARSSARSTRRSSRSFGSSPGFAGYYLIEAGDGVLSSLGLFETSERAEESGRLVSKWINDEHFSTVIPSAPMITSGRVVARSGNGITVT